MIKVICYAPLDPKLFFLIEPYKMPKSNDFKYKFLLISSLIVYKPTTVIILEAKLRYFTLHVERMPFIEFIPYYDIALSAKFIVSNFLFCKILLRVIIELTPNLIE